MEVFDLAETVKRGRSADIEAGLDGAGRQDRVLEGQVDEPVGQPPGNGPHLRPVTLPEMGEALRQRDSVGSLRGDGLEEQG